VTRRRPSGEGVKGSRYRKSPMCGIAGTFRLPQYPGAVPAMMAAISHRGPDAEGIYKSPVIAGTSVGNRRLAIIDLSEEANQPFFEDGLCLVYNGEIYNFREVRRQLEALGDIFRTNADTEVVIKAWRRWGPACLRRLRGMFALALLDEKRGRLFLARDPLGIKPLFYTRREGGLVFASEIKALRAALPVEGIDQTGLVASLMYYWIPDEHSAFRGVEKLPPGHWAEVGADGGLKLTCYWDPRQELVADPGPERSAAELAEVIEQSVRVHLVSDVPVASFLSGGLDSSLVTVLAARADPDIEAYTISFRPEDQRFEAMPDDAAYARRLASRLGIPLHEIQIAPDVADMLPRMVGILDEPVGDPAAINTYLICRAGREAGVKVMLSGMGADELFGGYRKHLASLLAVRYRRLPARLRRGLIEPIVRALPVATRHRGFRYSRWAKRFISFAGLDEAAAFQRSYTLFGDAELRALLSPDLRPEVDRLQEEHAAVYWQGPPDDQVNRMCYTDLRLFLTGLNLAYTDRASMAASTEVRVPYVDIEVAKAAFAIPGRRKIEGRTGKAVLKAAAEGLLPKEIVHRPKGLFSAPLRAWVRRDLRTMVDDLLADGELVRDGLLSGDMVRALVEADRRGIEDRSKEIWQLLTLETWYRDARSPRAARR
jgi:asparagine synthase (glutamine-hydrolysing)